MTVTAVQPPLDPTDHWPCKLPLGTAGYCRVWKPIDKLRRGLNRSAVPGHLEMTVDDLIQVLMEPMTFGPETPPPVSGRLAEIAAIAEVAPRSALLCLLAAEEISVDEEPALIDLPSEEVTCG
jgi:hypothetical protein